MNDQKDSAKIDYDQKLKETSDLDNKVKKITKQQTQLSDKILNLSIGNGMKQNDKETIMILLMCVVKELNGLRMQKGQLLNNINQIENVSQREEVVEMFKKYKLLR